MIQRIQTLYLFLAAVVAAFLGFYNPSLWRAKLISGSYAYFKGQSHYQFFILNMILIILAIVCIFLFKKRRLQLRLTILNILATLGLIAVQYFLIQTILENHQKLNDLASSTYLPAAFLPIVIVILLFLAARGIYKDQRLVKSLDRLR